jgi:tRNA U34 5-carboxymethylaminomethyl modifying GTPase MnmE/TrmE
LSADISQLVERAQDMLQGVDPSFVEAIVDRARGPEGDALREIWHFARRHELIDTYADIAAVAERASAPTVDVGVFGRTNVGKSSLINALVGQDVLPVGPAPTTTIPLRLALGPAGLRVHRAGKPDEDLPLDDLQGLDPTSLGDNEGRHGPSDVVAPDAFVPTAPPGLRLIDTPGVGSHTESGGARTFEWIPRCDLGLLLVSAGSALEAEDIAVAGGLLAAGVELRVLLSKADLLTGEELEASRVHLQDELIRLLGEGAGTILPVSVVANGAVRPLERLRAEVLDPLATGEGPSSEGRLRRRLQHLVREVEAAFEAHASETAEGATDSVEALHAALSGALPSS